MLFSIIVPCYNVSNYIRQCVESILAQTYDDFELILVNDGSTDDTLDIIQSYQVLDPRIRIINKTNGGLVSARKAGALLSSGDYIIVVDGDDYIARDYLEGFATVISEYAPDVVTCGYVISGDKYDRIVKAPKINGQLGYVDGDSLRKSLYHTSIFQITPNLWSKAFRRTLYMKYQMQIDNAIIMGEDGVVTYPAIWEAASLYITAGFGYHYRVVGNSLTHNKRKYIPFESAEWRIAFLERSLGDDKQIQAQIAAYAVHSYFNSLLTIMRRYGFSEAKKIINSHLSNPKVIVRLKNGVQYATLKERIARWMLLNHRYFLLKAVSIIF